MADVYMMMVDGKLTGVDLEPVTRRFRTGHVGARAEVTDQVVALLMDEAFDPGATLDAAEAAGICGGVLDAAGSAAVMLSEVERGQ
jgi:hypothetical protein